MKNFFINFIIFFFSFILFIILLETFARYKKPSWHEFSQDLGWELKKNFSHIYKNKDIFGNIYLSKIETDELGFRTHGNKNSKIKILVIGDSFTADPYSANDKMWYSILANEVKKKIKQNVFVYAGGGGGYGTLQEYLLLKKINEKIDYNLFILQFCGNDYGNNTYEAEKNSLLLNQTYKRPYIDISNGNIFYNPNILGKIFRNPILGESKIYNKILFYYSILYKKYFNHYKNEAINEEDLKKKQSK